MPVFLKIQRFTTAFVALAGAFLLAACSMYKMTDLVSQTPSAPTLDLPAPARTTVAPVVVRAAVTAADFVGADGACGPSPGAATAQSGGIELGMTECALVQRAGPPDKLDLGADERGERVATMLYSRGERPGLYTFTGGQLTSIERVAAPPAPPPPPKPQKPAKPAPRRAPG
jgi:hypothetical protein